MVGFRIWYSFTRFELSFAPVSTRWILVKLWRYHTNTLVGVAVRWRGITYNIVGYQDYRKQTFVQCVVSCYKWMDSDLYII